MDNFDLKKYLAEGRLLKEGIPQGSEIADYVEAMFNDSVVEKEGFQSDIWTKAEYAATSRDEGSVFMDLANHLNSVGGKDVLEGNPDINLELLSNGDIKWSADVTLDENLAEGKLLKEDVEKISNEEFTIVYDADDMTDYKVYNRLLSDDEADEAEEDFKVLDDDIETFVLDSETPAREILDYASSQEELEDYGLSKYWKFK